MTTENKIAIGVPSGTGGSFCFDVTRDCFIELEGREPYAYDDGLEVDASFLYKNLYRVECVPDVKLWKRYGECKTLLKVEYDDWGVVSLEETDIPVVRKKEDNRNKHKDVYEVDKSGHTVILEPKLNHRTGLVYPDFNAEKHITKIIPKEGLYYISINYGTVNPCSMGLWCVTNDKAVRIREYYYNSRKTGWQLTDEEYYKALETLVNDLPIERVVVDLAAASFIECISRHGCLSVCPAQNDPMAGIRLTSGYLEAGRLLFHESCTSSIAEFGLYMWDEKATSARPMKEYDHAMDDIRYFCSTVLCTL